MSDERKTIVITGASDGIGAAAARQLAGNGERVVLVGRSRNKTEAIAREIDAPFHIADYAELEQVRELAADLATTYPRIDVLANNAGGIFGDRKLTKDGFEQTFQVNHLAGFLLTNLLLENLIASNASVIQTSSVAAKRFSKFDIDDLQGEHNYSGRVAYGNAKLANILFTRELDRRVAEDGLSTAAFHPGVVATSFASSSGGLFGFIYTNPLTRRFMTTTEDGGSRLTFLATGTPGQDWISGEYYERDRPMASHRLSRDDQLARQLWERSAELVGLSG
ncbi:SDR family NAD(P)-dependent oxidoreductase [Microbacterium marmarense]|uniref:SDR family NAD(P)-dependent oxidoreductase n=1 Tax=Microbacterium marmarense TaxID=3122051 RepID=A0ABU8LTY6_9MICO